MFFPSNYYMCFCFMFQWNVEEPAAPISHATFSCDSQLVYASFMDGTVRVFTSNLQLQCLINPNAYIPPDVRWLTFPCYISIDNLYFYSYNKFNKLLRSWLTNFFSIFFRQQYITPSSYSCTSPRAKPVCHRTNRWNSCCNRATRIRGQMGYATTCPQRPPYYCNWRKFGDWKATSPFWKGLAGTWIYFSFLLAISRVLWNFLFLGLVQYAQNSNCLRLSLLCYNDSVHPHSN